MKVDGLKEFSNIDRSANVTSAQGYYDLIVIGGGITGAGILLDASLRGMKVLLLEKNDFASGTSSKSTKLIHGGLRYLKQLEFGLVRETGSERSVAHKNACHLVHPEKMLLPIVKNGSFSKFSASLAVSVYDLLANVPSEQRRKTLSKDKVNELEPLLRDDLIKSGVLYSEYRTDDARLTIELIKAALRNDAAAFNYMEVKKFTYEGENISGVICWDHIQEKEIVFSGKQIVSSGGPWVDEVSKRENKDSESNLHLSKGSHIVLDKKDLNLRSSTYFDAFDGRMIFAIPRGRMVYIGTTDTTYNGDLDEIKCTEEDAEYLINAVKGMFEVPELSLKDIKSTWAGVRPLIKQKGKGPTEISRKDEIFETESGLITIAGGKLTGFRLMAEKVVDLVLTKSDKKFTGRDTKEYKIHHKPFETYQAYLDFIEALERKYNTQETLDIPFLVSSYGKDAEIIIKYAMDQGITIDESQLEYTKKYEAVYHPLDHIERRTGWLYFDIDRAKLNHDVIAENLRKSLKRNEEWKESMAEVTLEQIKSNGLEELKV